MIDKEGFRPNVGIVIANDRGQLLWAKRIGQNAWQFPQGGVDKGESPEQALYRELYEEVGLRKEDVKLLASTRHWLRYRLPKKYVRKNCKPLCIGQKQKWFLLKLVSDESNICFDCGDKAEFDGWQWVNYWYPVDKVVDFKRDVYRRALRELAPAQIELERGRTGDRRA
ncbi:RNA pyrophosphohydrolase [Porticoccus sp. W117]|uniref:RNA pyrophosphohydrolase n=1 Tax=Porticoccus sp. W117 TaxID=3054777 RepID=UPI00259861AC|nr:RNA pyrophosphohydrolase [Porticoccus sp. W117]MDM3870915.1 RNA pyrophosphohydrolase [Porticoccus sp. W117]